MSAPFSFPPPPPPPPKAAAVGYGDGFVQNHSQGGRGGRGGFRGRGRGNYQRGDASGGYSGHHYQGGSGGVGYQQQQPMTGQPAYPMNYPQQPQTLPQQPYQQHQQPVYPSMHSSSPAFQTSFVYPSQGYTQAPFNGHYPVQAGYGYPPQMWNQSMQQQQNIPAPMGPPIRLGFDHGQNQKPSNYQVPIQANPSFDSKRKRDGNFDSRGTSNNGRFQRGGNSNVRPQKKPKVEAAPAVPSFGPPLPTQVPSAKSTSNDTPNAAKRKKKKRKTNQLGLTPAGEEHESSEEEVDEEAIFAAAGGPLQIEYKGKTSVLGTAADIASWIDERKKKFPTKARVEAKQAELQQRRQEQAEVRKKTQEAQAEARKKAQEAHAEARRKIEVQAASGQAALDSVVPTLQDTDQQLDVPKKEKNADEKTKKALERHLAKAEKLRKKLEKSQARADKAAATLAAETQPQDSPAIGAVGYVQDGSETKATADLPETSTAGPISMPDVDESALEKPTNVSSEVPTELPLAEEPLQALEEALEASMNAAVKRSEAVATNVDKSKTEPDKAANISPPSSISSESDSDSLSDTSEDDTDSDSSSDSSPEETSTKSAGPVRVPPPKRDSNTRVCRYFLAKGHCTMGERCKFKHELPERGAGSKAASAANANEVKKEKQNAGKQPVRKTLFQRLVEQEHAEEDKLVLKAIKYLGENGLFQGESHWPSI